jgi:hypothetical protein
VILCPNAGGDIARPPQLVNVYMKRENTEGKKTKEEEEEDDEDAAEARAAKPRTA